MPPIGIQIFFRLGANPRTLKLVAQIDDGQNKKTNNEYDRQYNVHFPLPQTGIHGDHKTTLIPLAGKPHDLNQV